MKMWILALSAAAIASQANAGVVTFDFGSATGNIGNTKAYTDLGLTVTAKGFAWAGGTADLYGKHNGGDEDGVGLNNDPTQEHEIHYKTGFVQIDVSKIEGKVTGMEFSMGSTTSGEQWGVYGSNTSGSLGTLLAHGSSEKLQALPDFGQYKFYDFVAYNNPEGQGDNVLLHEFTGTISNGVPEPATWAMMLIGVAGLGAAARSRRNAAIAAA